MATQHTISKLIPLWNVLWECDSESDADLEHLDLRVKKGQAEGWSNNFHLTASGGVYLGKWFSN